MRSSDPVGRPARFGSRNMAKILDEETALERRNSPSNSPGKSGRYVREIGTGPFWGIVTPHGGYLMALMLHAIELEVDDPARRPRMLSQHFLAAIKPGEVAIDVTIERVGRGVTSVSARMSSRDQLVGLATAILTLDGEGPAFQDESLPDVPGISEPDREMTGFSTARVHDQFDFHRRFGSDDAVLPCEDGGWIVIKHPGAWDHRLALVASDVWVPPIIRHPERISATPSLHHVAHFGPDVGGAASTPLLVRHCLSSGGRGVTDEDIALWAEDGRLLMRARQLRTVVPTQKLMGREFATHPSSVGR